MSGSDIVNKKLKKVGVRKGYGTFGHTSKNKIGTEKETNKEGNVSKQKNVSAENVLKK